MATGKLADGAVTNSKLGADSVTGSNVATGSLPLGDLSSVAITVDPPNLTAAGTAGACAAEVDVNVPGKTASQGVLVIPGSATAGWNGALVLDGYGSASLDEIDVQFCNVSGIAVDAGPQPLAVFLLG